MFSTLKFELARIIQKYLIMIPSPSEVGRMASVFGEFPDAVHYNSLACLHHSENTNPDMIAITDDYAVSRSSTGWV